MLQPRPHVRRGGRWPLVLGGVVAVLFLLARQQSSSRDEDAAARPVIEERFKQNVELAVSAWPRVEVRPL